MNQLTVLTNAAPLAAFLFDRLTGGGFAPLLAFTAQAAAGTFGAHFGIQAIDRLVRR
ncbi:hypothetical protein [Spirillospora albida]|uniref:hypothetical protein n=1 Tax=Spirillospora albida TaxID=58123 RepID=UPI0012FC2CCC|nr:hypothetical protein [Spirillospora albida]